MTPTVWRRVGLDSRWHSKTQRSPWGSLGISGPLMPNPRRQVVGAWRGRLNEPMLLTLRGLSSDHWIRTHGSHLVQYDQHPPVLGTGGRWMSARAISQSARPAATTAWAGSRAAPMSGIISGRGFGIPPPPLTSSIPTPPTRANSGASMSPSSTRASPSADGLMMQRVRGTARRKHGYSHAPVILRSDRKMTVIRTDAAMRGRSCSILRWTSPAPAAISERTACRYPTAYWICARWAITRTHSGWRRGEAMKSSRIRVKITPTPSPIRCCSSTAWNSYRCRPISKPRKSPLSPSGTSTSTERSGSADGKPTQAVTMTPGGRGPSTISGPGPTGQWVSRTIWPARRTPCVHLEWIFRGNGRMNSPPPPPMATFLSTPRTATATWCWTRGTSGPNWSTTV